jgi:hypothetical protein
MTKRKRQGGRVDLGRASECTLGSTGDYPDFVRTMDHWGIARDCRRAAPAPQWRWRRAATGAPTGG